MSPPRFSPPQETDKLFAILRNMKADGKAIIIITHKLHEVMDISDKVAVLRKGQVASAPSSRGPTPEALPT